MDYDPLETVKEFLGGVLGLLGGVFAGIVFIALIWAIVTNLNGFRDQITQLYVELWILAVILLPVWVIWLVVKK